LGHATRCVPLIRQLIADNTVILGVTKTTSPIFNEEFPELKKIEIEPYQIKYSKFLPLPLKLLIDVPRIFGVIKKEKQQLQKIIDDERIDVVISDNRFGLYNKDIHCIYITHQLNIKAGLVSFLANKIHHFFINKFTEVWAPDFEDKNKRLAGDLSENIHSKNVKYIGPLSRLLQVDIAKKKFDYLCLLSGPEPHRTLLEIKLIQKANKADKKICVVRGSHSALNTKVNQNISVYNMPTNLELSQLVATSQIIVCRSGFSTLMDLNFLKKKSVILIPTPGQAEQFYLAKHWNANFGAKICYENDLDLFDFQ
jgi:uncharacterized protein (TIGR00661 family)